MIPGEKSEISIGYSIAKMEIIISEMIQRIEQLTNENTELYERIETLEEKLGIETPEEEEEQDIYQEEPMQRRKTRQGQTDKRLEEIITPGTR